LLEVAMKLDTHVHTLHSGYSTIKPLDRLMAESYNTPDGVYRLAKSRGMDLVAITDHDRIDGALMLADRPDVIVGCEVTGVFPRDGVRVHLGVLGITETQHDEIQRRRHDIAALMPYLKRERIFVSLNHVASRINGHITAAHIAALIPWIDGLEVVNGSRLALQNHTAARLAEAHAKVRVAGSDSHTYRGVGLTWIDAPHATTREEFLTELHAGRVQTGGRQGSVLTMASDVVRVASSVYADHGRQFLQKPWRYRRQLMMLGLALGFPLISIPLVLSALHFLLEARFNRELLNDITQRPDLRMPELA
jgi:predicted metal-dependent phosphoesterase TrpH